ncbi:D-alanine--D-alanine ligase family protein [Paenibacillus pini]|uniref:D-alanine-D-alanine ligase n=1 Tax=Paenibacillus pini JCM 16418 TaxID=1236976 RepID=W7YNP4_9BACL|nr:ATP-grasp domain-containing protein [Paenibacillus pini]GAF09238.1 D-alanine-D-alanine ligase [Paenibacillus pini JCM 16418]
MGGLGIVYGGQSIESDYSRKALEYLESQISGKLNYQKYDISEFLYNQKNLDELESDLKYFSLVYGSPGQEGIIQGLLNMKGIEFIGSDQFSSSLVKNKKFSKDIAFLNHYYTPKYTLICSDDNVSDKLHGFNYPLVVKPNKMGGLSLGISVCYSEEEIYEGIKEALKYDYEILIEEYVEGTEYTACVIKRNGSYIVLPLIEVMKEENMSGSKEKINGKRKLKIDPPIDEMLETRIGNMVLELFKLFNMKDFGYFDLIVNNEEVFFIEAGAVPGFTENSNIPQLLRYTNITVEDFLSEYI